MKQALIVFLGGGLGSSLRFLISKFLNPLISQFYLGTFTVNIVGCLVIGFVMGLATKNQSIAQNTVLFFATGFCGGFTTFSAFALEKHNFLKQAEIGPMLIYLSLSIVLGILGVAVGAWLVRFVN